MDSDDEGLILTLETFPLLYNDNKYIQTRVFNDKAIQDFKLQLNYENWGNVFGNICVNDGFNKFLILTCDTITLILQNIQ
jgi:hypothetical protein